MHDSDLEDEICEEVKNQYRIRAESETRAGVRRQVREFDRIRQTKRARAVRAESQSSLNSMQGAQEVPSTELVFVDGAVQLFETDGEPYSDAVLFSLSAESAQPLPADPSKPIQLHDCGDGSAIYADAQSLAAMNAAHPLTGSLHTWATEVLASSSKSLGNAVQEIRVLSRVQGLSASS